MLTVAAIWSLQFFDVYFRIFICVLVFWIAYDTTVSWWYAVSILEE